MYAYVDLSSRLYPDIHNLYFFCYFANILSFWYDETICVCFLLSHYVLLYYISLHNALLLHCSSFWVLFYFETYYQLIEVVSEYHKYEA